jgi:DNA polymerase-3 subunit beta
MTFTVSSSELLHALQKAAGAIGSNPVLPVLEDFLFELDESKLSITASNLEVSISTQLEVISEDKGAIAIPAKILLDTLKALPEQPVSIVVDLDNQSVEITSSYGKYHLSGDNPEDFPNLPEEENTDYVHISGEIIEAAISKTLFATSNDELRLAMNGVYTKIDFNDITFVATDAHKLVKYSFKEVNSDVDAAFILPKKAMGLLKTVIGGDETVKLSFNSKNAFFRFDNTTLICRLIDAKYPDYNAVIPVNNPNIVTIVRKDFLNSMKRISIYANKTTNQVSLNISNDSLTISAQDLDFSNDATEQMACQYSGDSMTIGFNAKFLVEMLSVLDSKEVILELSTPNKAGILLPSESRENEELLMLVMPVMIGN